MSEGIGMGCGYFTAYPHGICIGSMEIDHFMELWMDCFQITSPYFQLQRSGFPKGAMRQKMPFI